jgi:long-chain acyl-CoA synthetase
MEVDLDLYREEVVISEDPLVRLSVIDVTPEAPIGTIVMVHGFGGQGIQWQYQLKAFAARYRVIAFDLRGHGYSDKPHSSYTMDEFQNDLNRLISVMKIQCPFVLIGHSFGGALVTEFAHRRPQDVLRLILIAAAGEYVLLRPAEFMLSLPLPLLRAIYPMVKDTYRAAPHVLKNTYFNTMSVWQGWSMFRDLRMPVLVIRGERDQVYPQGMFEEVAKSIPNAEEVNVGVSAHMVMLERADAVHRAIERFLTEESSRKSWSAGQPVVRTIQERRPWLEHYEPGVPVTLGFPHRPLHRLLRSASRRYGSRPATVFMGRTLNYSTLDGEANRLANALRSLGIEKGTRVMVLLPNTPQFVMSYYAVLKAGGVVVSSSPTNDHEELRRQIEDSGAEVLITLSIFGEMVRTHLRPPPLRHVIYTELDDYAGFIRKTVYRRRYPDHKRLDSGELEKGEYLWTPLCRRYPNTAPRIEISPDETAVLQYTGGTTDKPKAVMLTHRALLANTLQTRHWVTGLKEGQESVLAVIPFSHSYGATAAMNVAIALGAALVILPNFETESVLKAIKQYHPTLFPGVPSMYMAINQFPAVRKYEISSIKACISGAAPLPVEVQEAFEKLTRGRLVEGYGLTEAGPVTHANPLRGLRKVGSIGIPIPGTEAMIVSLKDGSPLPPNQIGELAVRGPQIMNGYWGKGAETDQVLRADGWLLTGDVARMDEDGYFQIISRKKDIWYPERELPSDYPAFPRDVEEVIYEMPKIQEAVVLAYDRKPIAFVKAKGVESGALIEFCKRRLPPELVPQRVIFVDEFPRTFVGKVLHRELVRKYATQLGDEESQR